MLNEHLRDKKFDVILGNPPYCHLRGLGNRRYAAYPKQRDLAQVFVRWALDHLTEDGVIGYNTSYTWLNKTMDGSIDTRERVNNRVTEIVMTEDIVRYSEEKAGSGGGDIPTFVFAATANHTDFMLFNGKKIAYMDVDIMKAGFINMCENHGMKWPFRSVAINSYFLSDSSTQSTNKKGTNTDFLATFVYHKFEENGDFYLMTKRAVFEHTYKGSFKLVKCTDPRYTVNDRLESQIIHPKVSYQHGMCLIGYLNTDMAKGLFDKCTVVMPNHGGWCAKLASNKWHLFKVPDFDYYKQDRSERFQAYMEWIEQNMHDKDKFLAGIDEQFEALIA